MQQSDMLSKRIDNRGVACRRLRLKVKDRPWHDQPVFVEPFRRSVASRCSIEGTQIGGKQLGARLPTEDCARLMAESTLLDSEEISPSYLGALK